MAAQPSARSTTRTASGEAGTIMGMKIRDISDDNDGTMMMMEMNMLTNMTICRKS